MEIATETLRLTIDPAHGSVIRRFVWRQADTEIDLLRPAPAGSSDPLDSGCFPLVPFSKANAVGER
ncbi:MAG: aldose 1-epimerase, partial [Pseudomonadota bacterium]